MKHFVIWSCIVLELSVWVLGTWLMVSTDKDPYTVGRAMATVTLILAMPVFWVVVVWEA